MNKRKAAIGYATYVVAGRVARTVVGRRRARRSMRTRAVIAHHRRRNGSHDPD
jgi:hypothetical protein